MKTSLTRLSGRAVLLLLLRLTAWIRKSVSTSVIDEDGRNDGDRKENVVDEKVKSHLFLNEPDKSHEGVAKEAEVSLHCEKNEVINDAAVVPKRGPYGP
jgi:hypothetical protein